MGRPRREQRAAGPGKASTADRLLRAAEQAFGRFGFNGARLEDIAKSVGITRPSLLYHFSSKDELYARVVQRASSLLRQGLEAAVGRGGEFAELLERVLQAYLDFLYGHPHLAAVLLREMIEGRSGRTRVLLRELLPLINWMEDVLVREGRGVMREGLPVRAAILQITTASLVQCTAGPLRRPIWGTHDRTLELARLLFLDSPSQPSTARGT